MGHIILHMEKASYTQNAYIKIIHGHTVRGQIPLDEVIWTFIVMQPVGHCNKNTFFFSGWPHLKEILPRCFNWRSCYLTLRLHFIFVFRLCLSLGNTQYCFFSYFVLIHVYLATSVVQCLSIWAGTRWRSPGFVSSYDQLGNNLI